MPPQGRGHILCPTHAKVVNYSGTSHRASSQCFTTYICQTCGPVASVDGEELRYCPICGQNHLEEGVFANRVQSSWTCVECDQEFRLPPSLIPIHCPMCKAILTVAEHFDWGEKGVVNVRRLHDLIWTTRMKSCTVAGAELNLKMRRIHCEYTATGFFF